MEATDVLTTLTALECQVSAEGDTLRILDPHHALTDALRQAIRQHKQDLLSMLAQSASVNDASATATAPSTQATCIHQAHVPSSPPPYPGRPVGAPFRPGHQVWLYR